MKEIQPGHYEFFNNGEHRVYVFSNLVKGEGVQSNQFLLFDHEHSALIDPGGDLTFVPLSIAVSRLTAISELDYIFASHQDPDILASMPKWMTHSECKVICSTLWKRFLPHFASSFVNERAGGEIFNRIIGLPDEGAKVPFGQSHIICVPAHFLHSVGNFQFYDPVSKILFSGDLGSSMIRPDEYGAVDDFDLHIPRMHGFHQRYMANNQAIQNWLSRARKLDIEMIVPQHGCPFIGKEKVAQFMNWISTLECGTDIMR